MGYFMSDSDCNKYSSAKYNLSLNTMAEIKYGFPLSINVTIFLQLSRILKHHALDQRIYSDYKLLRGRHYKTMLCL